MVRVRHAASTSQCLALERRHYRRLGCVRLEIALADHELVEVWWLRRGGSVALIGKDVEGDEMPSFITHQYESLTPGITDHYDAIPTVHLPTHALAAKMYESA
jgi:hypothetical protein